VGGAATTHQEQAMASDTTRDSGAAETRRGRGRQADHPEQIPSEGWKDIGKRVIAEIKADHVPVVAAGVAFYAWLAVIPAIIALVTIYGLIASPEQVTSQLESMTSSLSSSTSQVITDTVKSATSANSGGLTFGLILSLAGVLWTASGGMDGLIKGINIAYDEDPRSFPKRRGLALLLTLGAIVAAILAIGLTVAFPPIMESLGLSAAAQILANVVRWVLLVLLVLGGLAVIYRIAPHRDDPRFEWVTRGAVVATALWVLGSVGFALYVRFFGSYNATYGALAGVIILNLWLFLSSFIVLLGAEINSEMEAQTAHDSTKGEPQPMGERDAAKADDLGEAAAK
jgi:membrane protein